jgi:hypothetical protein
MDNGGWYARGSDKEFYSAGCGRAKDYIITNAGPIATFSLALVLLSFCEVAAFQFRTSTKRIFLDVTLYIRSFQFFILVGTNCDKKDMDNSQSEKTMFFRYTPLLKKDLDVA